MTKRWLQLLAAAAGGIMGYHWLESIGGPFFQWVTTIFGISDIQGKPFWMMGIGMLVFFAAAVWVSEYGMRLVRKGEESVSRVPFANLVSGLLGLIIGLLISVLLFPSLEKISAGGSFVPIIVTFALGGYGFRFGYTKKDDITAFISLIRIGKEPEAGKKRPEEHKILDTSVIIDGRIADICKTGFIEGTLVIPEFVLEELQHIADSSDLLKRNRGRRGLDILNKIQKELEVKVLIYEGDFEEISEVDSKLVRLAKVLGGKVITNDFNLNKVCELQGVPVLNINDLANAVKPVVLPGEEIFVQVIKDGKEYGQGVAYLDDGTMIVVEGGREYIGTTMEVMVTSVLQTSAGRMIFAKPKLLEKAQ
ncbi:PIN/TRAM domain-containing protein [Paenibacillus contaminans]|uniref:Twitching motility protein PilT n=1 Tax=Paenibacillus contaminans TaxID=450362 RepID=A0A329LSR1_9BACL|nr:PIN/TRAM domain-containing protein [Paenibacillus contaminans]RAV10230.1 twitching motility protein PilT [Paenibacillus contaminans]